MAKIQRQGIKTDTEIVTAGGAIANLPGDDQVYVSANSINKTLKNAILDGDIGAGSNVANVLAAKDSEFDVGTFTWATYADAAGTTPVDATGGTANITIATTTISSEVLKGTKSLKLTKDAANRQGEGFSVNYSVPQAYLGKPSVVSFDYKLLSGTFTNGSPSSASDVQVYLVDVTSGAIITPFPNYLDGSGSFKGFFQFLAGTSAQNYRLAIHVSTASASAYTLSFDNFFLGKSEPTYLSADTDWQSKTLTASGFTFTSQSFQTRKEGPDLLMRGRFVVNTTAGTEARILFPDNLLSSSSISTLEIAGVVGRNAATANFYGYYSTREPSVGYITFGIQTSAQNALTKQLGTGLTAGEAYTIEARIPIQGWSSGYTSVDTMLQNVPVVFRAYRNGGSITANTTIASWTSVEKDSVGAFNSTTGQYTVKVPGDYYFSATIGTTASLGATSYISKNGTITILGSNESSDNRDAISGVIPNLVVGDVIDLKLGASGTAEGTNYATTFMCFKIESPNALLTTNRSTQKSFTADITTDTNPVTQIGFSNLVVGKRYRVSADFAFISTTSFNVTFTYTNGSTVVLKTYSAPVNGASPFVSANAEFVATATTLVAAFDVSNTGTIYGTTTLSNGNRFILTELNNTVEGNF
jgi:hypothetical protein